MATAVVASPVPAYLSLPQAARLVPPNKGARPVHPSTLTRWILDGVRLSDGSRVRLKAKRFPLGWKTIAEWIDEFVETITADALRESLTPAGRPARDDAASSRELTSAVW